MYWITQSLLKTQSGHHPLVSDYLGLDSVWGFALVIYFRAMIKLLVWGFTLENHRTVLCSFLYATQCKLHLKHVSKVEVDKFCSKTCGYITGFPKQNKKWWNIRNFCENWALKKKRLLAKAVTRLWYTSYQEQPITQVFDLV